MATIKNVRNELIEKILTIENKDFLLALDKLITSSTPTNSNKVSLSDAQIKMLELSEKDIENGRLISQEAMIQRNQEWLNAM